MQRLTQCCNCDICILKTAYDNFLVVGSVVVCSILVWNCKGRVRGVERIKTNNTQWFLISHDYCDSRLDPLRKERI